MKKSICLILVSFLILSFILPFNILADNSNVGLVVSSGTCYATSSDATYSYKWDDDVVIVAYTNTSNNSSGSVFTLAPPNAKRASSTGGCPINSTPSTTGNTSLKFWGQTYNYLEATYGSTTDSSIPYYEYTTDYALVHRGYLGTLMVPEYSQGVNLLYIPVGSSSVSWTVGSNPYTITATADIYIGSILPNSGNSMTEYIFSYSPNTVVTLSRGGTDTNISLSYSAIDHYGNTFYYNNHTGWNYNSSSYTYTFPVKRFNSTDLGKWAIFAKAVEQSGGSGGGGSSINHGDLNDLGFYTKFTNSQQTTLLSLKKNIDVLTWDGYQDTNGNQINTMDYMVDIEAYATEYYDNSKSDLLNQGINNLLLVGTPVNLVSISPNIGKWEFTWEEVATALVGSNAVNNYLNSINLTQSENKFYTKGWIYRIRLRTHDSSWVGNWQIVYNMTSAPPQDSQNIYNYYYTTYSYGYDPGVQNSINNINTYNTTNNYWYSNELPIDPNANNNNTSSWWDALLRLIEKLIDALTDVFIELLKGIINLITDLGINLLQTFTNLWNSLLDLLSAIDVGNIDLEIPDLSPYAQLVPRTLDIFIGNGFGLVIWIPLIICIVELII